MGDESIKFDYVVHGRLRCKAAPAISAGTKRQGMCREENTFKKLEKALLPLRMPLAKQRGCELIKC